MWIFDPKCDNDDETEYIGWGDGNSIGYGTGCYEVHSIPRCETFFYGDEWEDDGCGAGIAKGSGFDYYDD